MVQANWKRQWRLPLFLWFLIASHELVFAREIGHGNNSQDLKSSPPLTLDIQRLHLVMDNGLVRVTLSNPDGLITEIKYEGVDNVLDYHQKESRRGYWDIMWQRQIKGKSYFAMIQGTSFKVIAQDENQIEVSFKTTYDPAHDHTGSALPLNIDKRFIMLRGQSGFYSYAIFERLNGWPAVDISETRIAFKLDQGRFNYMAIADDIQKVMPTNTDRQKGQPLAYPEAVLLTNATNPAFKGEVDDKYQYSKDNKDNHVHGWITSDSNVGFWVIIPSYEFKTGGPVKRELTSHVGPTTLATFYSRHYAGATLKGLQFEDGEPWKKVFGPVFVYLNSNSAKPKPLSLWEDAKAQSLKETQKWPYDFPISDDFPPANQRATVRGRLQVNDRYLQQGHFPAKSAYVGLAPPGAPGSWQVDAKGYQFWTQTDDNGYFTISGVRPGKYNLYAWVPGILGDYKSELNVSLVPGKFNLGHFVFTPPRSGPTLWEIGIPDRTAAEFYVPDGAPGLVNPLYINHIERYRQYGLWERYTDLYPNHDLVYRVGVSDYRKDWFYAHVNRRTVDNSRIPTTWQISFDVKQVIQTATYTLRLALASASGANVQVRVNDANAVFPHFSTRQIGRDNAIARHGDHGLYQLFSFNIPGHRLVHGSNTIFLTQSMGGYAFNGVMYDYLRLEGPAV